jgi:acyl-CoA synthetase (AMP-forming)/AMP-acid ligase II
LAYFLKQKGLKRVGILAPNTPAFLESIFGIAAAGGVHVGVNYRLKVEDVAYIFEFAEVCYPPFLHGFGCGRLLNYWSCTNANLVLMS